MLVLARGPVGAGAAAPLDLALIEVFLETAPFGFGDGTVLIGRPGLAAPVEKALVVADNVFVEYCDVAPSCLKVQMPEQGCADMDRESAVHQIGGKESPEV